MDGWMDHFSLPSFSSSSRDDDDAFFYYSTAAPFFFLWARSRVFSPRVMRPGSSFVLAAAVALIRWSTAATAVKGARKFTPRPVLILMEQDAW
jgi:hypothetical protein